MEATGVKMSNPSRRTVEIVVNDEVVKVMPCSVSHEEVRGELAADADSVMTSCIVRIAFDAPVTVNDGDTVSFHLRADE